VTEYGTSYFIILSHKTTQKSFVISFVSIPFLRNKFIMRNASSLNVTLNCEHATLASLFNLRVNLCILRWCRERSWSPTKSELRSSEKLLKSEFSCCYACLFVLKCYDWKIMEICTWPKFSPFIYLNAIAFKNFKTSKMQPNVFLVHMIKKFYSSL